jgi:predicted DNA-binding protein (UPF0251 family)
VANITHQTETGRRSVERLSYNTEETCEALGISRTSLWRLVERDLIKPSRALRTLLFSRAEIERFLEVTK